MQDIYQQRNTWKFILAIVGAIILVITLFYSNYLAKNLEENELKNAALFKEAIVFLQQNKDFNADVGLHDFIVNNFALPVIIRDDVDSLSAFNFPEDQINNQAFLRQKVEDFLASGQKPLMGSGYSKELYFFNSRLLDYIRYFPLLQIFLVGSFVALGYFLFNSSKKAEQNRVWAGMAKETAHQLGTPISAIMGWVSHLKDNHPQNQEIQEITLELEKDVERLNLVADRFSKIGSAPELHPRDLTLLMRDVVEYMKRRASRQTIFYVEFQESNKFISDVNTHLFEWVVENLLRNALDAMDGKGKISVTFYHEDDFNCIDITDTGKGIPTSKFKTIFNPGYSTKTRGWGLGLSLAKRIVEEYHKGKIFVKASKADQGTTFCIKLHKTKRLAIPA
ncbi:MAG: HAMP domain-containing histidine kinase [Saprospiraceae bacterium]|nr:HAMP domain-containing histidine kinase [Saprospiraceae bacterium]